MDIMKLKKKTDKGDVFWHIRIIKEREHNKEDTEDENNVDDDNKNDDLLVKDNTRIQSEIK